MTRWTFNPSLNRLRPYRPGLTARQAGEKYRAPTFIKMASNENSYGPAPAVHRVLAEKFDVCRYPDADQSNLTAALAKHYQLTEDHIVVGAGSSELLDRVARLVLRPGRQAIYSQYAFSLYRQYTLCCGAEPVEIPALSVAGDSSGQIYGHDLSSMAAAVNDQTAIIFIASPNNPTGTWSQESALRALLDNIPDHVLVVVDQAYVEYSSELCPDYPELITWHQRYPNLIITRTFSKIYALASLRVGYLIADAELIEWLKKIRLPFNVSDLAQRAALAALAEQDYIKDCAKNNRREMRRLLEVTEELGLKTIPSVANFICIEMPSNALDVQHCLMKQGVIARALDEYHLPHHLRLTVGSPADNNQAIKALRRCITAL